MLVLLVAGLETLLGNGCSRFEAKRIGANRLTFRSSTGATVTTSNAATVAATAPSRPSARGAVVRLASAKAGFSSLRIVRGVDAQTYFMSTKWADKLLQSLTLFEIPLLPLSYCPFSMVLYPADALNLDASGF